VPTPINLDEWNFTSMPLLPVTSLTRSLYLVAFMSPVDRARAYVYGIDVRAGRFVFSGTVAKTNVVKLTTRTGIDLGNYQLEGPTDPFSGIVIQIGPRTASAVARLSPRSPQLRKRVGLSGLSASITAK
jgi:hypothetical protein